MSTKTGYGLKFIVGNFLIATIFAMVGVLAQGVRVKRREPPPSSVRSSLPASVCTPQVRGIAIGMTKGELSKLLGFDISKPKSASYPYPLYSEASRSLGYKGYVISVNWIRDYIFEAKNGRRPNAQELNQIPLPPVFQGIDTLSVGFLGDQLVNYEIRYTERFTKEGEFFEKIQSSLGLPRNGWQRFVRTGTNVNSFGNTLLCNGSAISIAYNSYDGPSWFKVDGKLDLEEAMAKETARIKEQKQIEEQKKRDTFKP